MPLSYVKHEPISLREHPDFTEGWLHDRICEDTSILGLGLGLAVIARERMQHAGGRLDILLAETEKDIRYEVEIMLGSTDPSHIIRCIEYWDIERRRYPAYDHIAVLVAENVTSRFLNVMSLLAGSIPLIAIQLNALRVGDQMILDFVKVLDQRQLRSDDEAEVDHEDVDRGTWDSYAGPAIMQFCDRVAQFANEFADPKLELKYKKGHVGLCPKGGFFNVIALFPRKKYVGMRMAVSEPVLWVKRLDDAGLESELQKTDRVYLRVGLPDLQGHEDLLRELVHQAVKEHSE